MSMFPSLADSARMDTPQADCQQTSSPTTSLYPDLSSETNSKMATGDYEDEDILTALGIPQEAAKKKPPSRPPPPRSHSLPVAPSALPLNQANTSDVLIPPPLFPHEVRWFYQEPSKYWQPFNGYDSMALEDTYNRLLNGGGGSCHVSVMGDLQEVNVLERMCRPIYWSDKTGWPVLRGGWFEVTNDKWYPLPEDEYTAVEEEHVARKWREKAKADAELQEWAKTRHSTTAAAPVRANSSPVIGSNLVPPAKKEQQQTLVGPVVINRLTLDKYHVMWMSNGDIYKMKTEITTQLWNKVGEKFGKGQLYGSSKLMRGYKEHASKEDRPPPIGHIVFTIHGVGQNMDISSINKSTSDFRETCTQVGKKYFGDTWREKRVEFIPVEWRTWLTLDRGMVGKITPHSIKKLRDLMNDSAIDVMYYLSPRFGPEILDGLKHQLHQHYNKFMQRHPNFLSSGGTVSVFAHSLGSVMIYDLLLETCEAMGVGPSSNASVCDSSQQFHSPTSTVSGSEMGPIEVKDDGNGSSVKFTAGVSSPETSMTMEVSPSSQGVDEPDISDPGFDEAAARLELIQLKKRVAELEKKLATKSRGLQFKIDHFFAVGSPLALFLAMREHEMLVDKCHKSAASFLPTCICKRIHNLHHPADPVAYRLEPLVNPLYTHVKPIKVDSAGSKPSKEAVDHAEGPKPEDKRAPQSKTWFSSFSQWMISSTTKKVEGTDSGSVTKPPDKVVDSDKTFKPEDKLKERLDFMLRESFAENSYLNSLTAHTGYWTSTDCAQYVLLQIYKYKQE